MDVRYGGMGFPMLRRLGAGFRVTGGDSLGPNSALARCRVYPVLNESDLYIFVFYVLCYVCMCVLTFVYMYRCRSYIWMLKRTDLYICVSYVGSVTLHVI